LLRKRVLTVTMTKKTINDRDAAALLAAAFFFEKSG
jgi:hypothetical protein